MDSLACIIFHDMLYINNANYCWQLNDSLASKDLAPCFKLMWKKSNWSFRIENFFYFPGKKRIKEQTNMFYLVPQHCLIQISGLTSPSPSANTTVKAFHFFFCLFWCCFFVVRNTCTQLISHLPVQQGVPTLFSSMHLWIQSKQIGTLSAYHL